MMRWLVQQDEKQRKNGKDNGERMPFHSTKIKCANALYPGNTSCRSLMSKRGCWVSKRGVVTQGEIASIRLTIVRHISQ